MKEWIHPEIGLILIKKNRRSKRLTIRVRPNKPVTINMPTWYPYWVAKQNLKEHLEWVKLQQQKYQQINRDKLINSEEKFVVRNRQLRFERADCTALQLQQNAHYIDILVPSTWDTNNQQVQEVLRTAFVEVLRTEAKAYLPQRTADLAAIHQIEYNTVRIKNMKSRWGSCSSKKNINYSVFLMLLPDALIDYVIVHELAHIKHQNHSPAFWQYLEYLLPGAKQLDAQVNQHRMPF